MTSDAVRAYYAAFGEREWTRLDNPDDGAVEFAITCRTLATYLPTAARVLDLGGGPGRYAIWLARRGHHVVLADLQVIPAFSAWQRIFYTLGGMRHCRVDPDQGVLHRGVT